MHVCTCYWHIEVEAVVLLIVCELSTVVSHHLDDDPADYAA